MRSFGLIHMHMVPMCCMLMCQVHPRVKSCFGVLVLPPSHPFFKISLSFVFFFFLFSRTLDSQSLKEVSCPEDDQRRIFLLPALADSGFQQTSHNPPKRLPTDFYVNIHESHANYSSPLTSPLHPPAGQRSMFTAMFCFLFFFPSA